jgi:hypothetical protein
MNDIEKFEILIAELEAKRERCAQRGRELLDERSTIALAAHTGDGKASKRLLEINAALALHASEVESLDAAIEAAGKKHASAEDSAARAASKQEAAALSKHVDELAEVPAFIDEHLSAALRGLIAFERGVEGLHQRGVPFPTAVQLRLGITAVLGTWLQQLPKMWWNEVVCPRPGLCLDRFRRGPLQVVAGVFLKNCFLLGS